MWRDGNVCMNNQFQLKKVCSQFCLICKVFSELFITIYLLVEKVTQQNYNGSIAMFIWKEVLVLLITKKN